MPKKLWIGVALIVLTAGCATIEGVGRDLQAGSQKVQRVF